MTGATIAWPHVTRMPLTLHTDPGHGWLEVSHAELVKLGIADQITKYSYRKGETCYLEEDCDASLFLAAAERAGYAVQVGQSHTERDSWIRSLRSYSNHQA